ncbi:MAG: ATP-dependent DNA helicase RecG [Dehalococcoidia bacterium]
MATQEAAFSLDSFRNILKLEQSKAYSNTSVFGGVDKFTDLWRDQIHTAFGKTREVNRLLEQPYAQMSTTQRKEWTKRWLALLNNRSAPEESPPSDGSRPPKKKTPPAKASPKKAPRVAASRSLDSPVTMLRGVDTKTAEKLNRLGVSTIHDLLYLFPRRHNDYSQRSKIADLEPGQEATVIATVWEARQIKMGKQGRLKATEAVVGDETGNIRVVWFGQTYLARQLTTGTQVALSGKVDFFNRDRVLQSPDYDFINNRIPLIHAGRLVPVYPLTEGLTARNLRRIMWQTLERWGSSIEEFMPQDIRERVGLEDLSNAVLQAHFPDDGDSWERARRRLAFDELLLLQTAVLLRRKDWQADAKGVPVKADDRVVSNFLKGLPFSLTNAQNRCLGETLKDMARGNPSMSRLLQGEVGSGKTVVALAALLAVASKGYQGSIMVPTELLAEQHFNTVCKLMGGLARPVQEENLITSYLEPYPQPISVGLVTGSTRKTLKRELQQRASEGALDIIIGTQTLIQEEMEMPNLALSVVDEQHRFGVMQRAALRGKGEMTPHMLIMSATPIPRTLALTLYGDLDISIIDELPPGRQKIVTKWVSPERRDAAYGFVRDQVHAGRQAFIIFPLIEESEAIEAKAATEEYHRLSQDIFPDLRLGLLHGRMAARKKDQVMGQFHSGELDILVSTPVVEVGIDVPNATVMMVESADRFGLAQLHQFRGRVGRGEHKSYCLLLADNPSELARERLSAIEQIHDGFRLAEVDLSLRGPGDLFGTRQSGLPNLRMARLSDQELLAQAREEAAGLLQKDPDLSMAEHQLLAQRVARFQGEVTAEIS